MSEYIDCSKILNNNIINNCIISFPTLVPSLTTLEVQEKVNGMEVWKFDLKTYICANEKCNLHYERSHKRISVYNWQKLQTIKSYTYIQEIKKLAVNLLQLLGKNNTDPMHYTKEDLNNTVSFVNPKQEIVHGCVYCRNSNLRNYKHIHFIKENKNNIVLKNSNKPIEDLFSSINNLAITNGINMHPIKPRKNNLQSNNEIRMTYGDINYIGNNTAYLHFDRGYQKIQIFKNSVYSLKMQPNYKDIIILDEIVFTSDCICSSTSQHKELFPHYRVTIAKGLTCPARLDKQQRILYARKHYSTNEPFSTAKQYLIRFW